MRHVALDKCLLNNINVNVLRFVSALLERSGSNRLTAPRPLRGFRPGLVPNYPLETWSNLNPSTLPGELRKLELNAYRSSVCFAFWDAAEHAIVAPTVLLCSSLTFWQLACHCTCLRLASWFGLVIWRQQVFFTQRKAVLEVHSAFCRCLI